MSTSIPYSSPQGTWCWKHGFLPPALSWICLDLFLCVLKKPLWPCFISFLAHRFVTQWCPVLLDHSITESALSYSKINHCRKSVQLQERAPLSLPSHFPVLKSQLKQSHDCTWQLSVSPKACVKSLWSQ